MPKLKEQDYLLMILRLTSNNVLQTWLVANPPPRWFPHGKYAWAYSELIIGERLTFVRK